MSQERPPDDRERYRLVLGCTNQGRHRWTALRSWRVLVDDLSDEPVEVRCPRCGRTLQSSGTPASERGQRGTVQQFARQLRDEADQYARGQHQLDISDARF
jgi:hypothetical protein